MNQPKVSENGFSLIELMIVVAIVAILASVALPPYREHVQKTRRADGQKELVTWANSLERYFSVNGTYLSGGACDTGKPVGTKSNDVYTFSTDDCSATTFTLKIAPKAGTSQEGDGDQTLTNTGATTGNWKM